jgi:hypothetical protein
MKQTDHRRQLLKDILSGKASPEQAQEELAKDQPKKSNLELLTPAEREIHLDMDRKYREAGKSLSALSNGELSLLLLMKLKSMPDYEKRHILDRVDLTALTEKQLDQAEMVLRQPWVKVFEHELPEWLKDARK